MNGNQKLGKIGERIIFLIHKELILSLPCSKWNSKFCTVHSWWSVDCD